VRGIIIVEGGGSVETEQNLKLKQQIIEKKEELLKWII
jgi:hypothetical protein